MIDIELIRNDQKGVAENLARRGVQQADIEQLCTLDETWRSLTQEVDSLRAQQNQANSEIAAAEGTAKQEKIAAMKQVATDLKAQEQQLTEIEEQRLTLWRSLPNLLADDVPDGDETASETIATSPTEPRRDEGLKSYLELFPELIDIERAAKVSGSRFVYLKGQLARLELALVSFAFDTLTKHNFTPVVPPVLVKEEAMLGMGYLDHEGDEIYKTQDDLYLVGTSEQAIGAMHMNEVLEGGNLPHRYVGFSTCFRREAGSHGKDVKGMLRVHQFDKAEMFSITTPEQSATEHEFLLERQRELMDALELPYEVRNMATGDLAAPAAKKYDIETWLPGEQAFRETSSTSNTTDWQARRLNIRVRQEDGKAVTAHMLNGTAVAVGRILIALIENHQQPDGSVKLPTVLHSYLPFTEIKTMQ